MSKSTLPRGGSAHKCHLYVQFIYDTVGVGLGVGCPWEREGLSANSMRLNQKCKKCLYQFGGIYILLLLFYYGCILQFINLLTVHVQQTSGTIL